MPIHLLPDEVASQIAAGEVVERPASVVKELIENALDAGAKHIDVRVEGAGKRLIEVRDDGCGIPSGELPLAVARHATSKLSGAEDLYRIRTLGFRGEALASIGSVSRLTITSRSLDEKNGARLRVEAGSLLRTEQVGAPAGSVVQVEDLFFSVPARLKFLKTDSTERQQMDTLVTRYALAYPHVQFSLQQDGRVVLQTSGSGERREALASIYGLDFARQMLEVQAEEPGLSVRGLISPINLTRSNRREMTFFVNGRWVQDAALAAAFYQAYQTMIMVGRYPLGYLFIDLPPEEVDVNVHPAKAEVRFRSPDRLFSGIQRAVRRALLAYSPVPQLEAPRTWDTLYTEESSSRPEDRLSVFQSQLQSGSPAMMGPATLPGGIPLLRLVGQIGAAYLVAEGPDGLYLIDQHAAHERVLFERFTRQSSPALPAQVLLKPESVRLPPQSARQLTAELAVLPRLGFDVESFGPDTFLIRAIPAPLLGSDPGAALRVLVEDFEEDETPLQAELSQRLIARICKRAAVRAGQVLSIEEQRALIQDLEKCQSPRTCPHGRPTMIHLSVDLLERQFGRRGPR